MAIISKSELKANIASELADNNAGLISAYDVRHNMEDIVDSVNQMVASGDFDVATPFTGSNVRAKIRNGQYGMFIAESGINFVNGGGIQYVPYPGASGIVHNDFQGLTVGDPHTQYLPVNGTRVMANNLGLANNWLNASGNANIVSSNNRGLQFETLSSSAENINVGPATKFVFKADNSTLDNTKGVARAWISFNGSGTPEVRDSYNVTQLRKLATGKFEIVFTSGTVKNNNYVAIGTSNSRSTSDSKEDFDLNTVGIVARSGDDASILRRCTFCVLNDNGEYVDAAMNDLVIYGLGPNVSSGTPPSVVVL